MSETLQTLPLDSAGGVIERIYELDQQLDMLDSIKYHRMQQPVDSPETLRRIIKVNLSINRRASERYHLEYRLKRMGLQLLTTENVEDIA